MFTAVFNREIMWRTILLLIITLCLVPFVSYKMDNPLSPVQLTTLYLLIKIMLAVALTCFAISQITGNCSQVDKIWSIMPIVYTWVVACKSDWQARLVLMAILVSIWGIRLSYNFFRRGGYHIVPWKGEEDYRWKIMRSKTFLNTKIGWAIFDLFFISLYQNGLILLFTLPILYCLQTEASALHSYDYIIASCFLILVILETVADQQQYNFQSMKYKLLAQGSVIADPYDKGFVKSGLWSYVRHPNYACEQAIWICFYVFTISATGHYFNWSITGCLLLMLLFVGSSDFSESISLSKYKEYKHYMETTPRFFPLKLK